MVALTCAFLLRFSFAPREGETVESALQRAKDLLKDAKVDEIDASVANLMAKSLDLPWKTGYRDVMNGSTTWSQRALTTSESLLLSDLVTRRMSHEPIQYLTGKWDFLDFTLNMEAPLLCPRPETEELVERVIKDSQTSPSNILDIGCGTGCIGIALAKRFVTSTVDAIDVESTAIRVSQANAQQILDDSTRYRALLSSIEEYKATTKYDLVVSNPPYIPMRDMVTLNPNVRNYESHVALSDGSSEDGMDIIRSILDRLEHICQSGAVCWMEIDPSQAKLLEQQYSNNGSSKVRFVQWYKDMYDQPRFVKFVVT